MREADRTRIVAALLGGVRLLEMECYQELVEMCTQDMEQLETIIDEIVERECRLAVTAVLQQKAQAAWRMRYGSDATTGYVPWHQRERKLS